MDWLSGMNAVLSHIENNLTEEIPYESLAKTAGCSTYEFSRIFSFMAGMSVSEYIRRRRLSQAVFDIQAGRERIIDIAMKYNYESQAAFSRAFKEMHGIPPLSARKSGAVLKNYPPISFMLTIRGAAPLSFRIEKKQDMTLHGLLATMPVEDENALAMLWHSAKMEFKPVEDHEDTDIDMVNQLIEDKLITDYEVDLGVNNKLRIVTAGGVPEIMYFTAAIDYAVKNGKVEITVGFIDIEEEKLCSSSDLPDALKDHPSFKNRAESCEYVTLPGSDWAVFSFDVPRDGKTLAEAYTRILTEWMPSSGYIRNKTIPHLEQMPFGPDAEKQPWEIWIPIAG